MKTLIRGKQAEDRAAVFLQGQGLKIIQSNYRCFWGEIDLIAWDGPCLVFVEVRSRASKAFGGALASVTYQKQQKIVKSALQYLSDKRLENKHPLRFDIVALENQELNWIKNAFDGSF